MTTDILPEETKGGHTNPKENVTANSPKHEDAQATFDVFVLLDHAFFMVIFSDTPENIYKAYLSFTKDILSLYHGKYDKDEIRSALIIAQDHLSILIEDTENGCEVSIKFAGRAVKFLKQYIQLIAEKCVANGIAEKKEVTIESSRISAYTFKWGFKFTEFIEIMEGMLEMECISDIARGEVKEALFIRVMMNLFGFKDKTLQDYRGARNKLRHKAPKDSGNAKILRKIIDNLEESWEGYYLSYSKQELKNLSNQS